MGPKCNCASHPSTARRRSRQQPKSWTDDLDDTREVWPHFTTREPLQHYMRPLLPSNDPTYKLGLPSLDGWIVGKMERLTSRVTANVRRRLKDKLGSFTRRRNTPLTRWASMYVQNSSNLNPNTDQCMRKTIDVSSRRQPMPLSISWPGYRDTPLHGTTSTMNLMRLGCKSTQEELADTQLV